MKNLTLILAALMLLSCSRNNGNKIVGGTSDQGNAITVGKVVDQNGEAVQNASVKLIPDNYNPGEGNIPDSLQTTTDSVGEYKFGELDSGLFNLEIISSDLAVVSLQRGIYIAADTLNRLPVSTLEPGKSVLIYAPDSLAEKSGYVYIAGTSISAAITNLNPLEEPILLTGLTDSVVPEIIWVETGDVEGVILVDNIPLVEKDTTTYLNYSIVTGLVVDENGHGVSEAVVSLVPTSYNPVEGNSDTLLSGKTNSEGYYHLAVNNMGNYNLEIFSKDGLLGNRIDNILVTELRTYGQPKIKLDTLSQLSLYLPAGVTKPEGYYFIMGTSISSRAAINDPYQDKVDLKKIVPGSKPDIWYQALGQNSRAILYRALDVNAQETIIDPYFYWSYSQKFVINTTSSGADVHQDLNKFPLPLRLNRFNFDFSKAKFNGEDIRISGHTFTPKPIEIESWDRANNSALIWIYLDTLLGNNDTQSFTLHWGNSQASMANAPTVFDTAAGFAGVWHLNEDGGTDSGGYIDQTQNNLHGTGFGFTADPTVDAILGKGVQFNGDTDYIHLINSKIGILNFPLNGPFSISVWAKPETLDGQFRPIIQKGKGQYALKLLADGQWEFNETDSKLGWAVTKHPAEGNKWVHITGVRTGDQQMLYINGEMVSDSVYHTGGTGRNSDFDAFIGRNSNQPHRKWKGVLDEVRISKEARSPAWIKMSYECQKLNSNVIVPVISQK